MDRLPWDRLELLPLDGNEHPPKPVFEWSAQQASWRYTQRRNDLRAMLKRFQFYMIGHRAQTGVFSKEHAFKVAHCVFMAGVTMRHWDHGSTGATTGPIFGLLTLEGKLRSFDENGLAVVFHAYAIQSSVTEALDATFSASPLTAWHNLREELTRADVLMQKGQQLCRELENLETTSGESGPQLTMPLDQCKDTLQQIPEIVVAALREDGAFVYADYDFRIRIHYWSQQSIYAPTRHPLYAMSNAELREELRQLLPLAKRLDDRYLITDPDQGAYTAIVTALAKVTYSPCFTDIDIVNMFQRYEDEPVCDIREDFVIAVVGGFYSNIIRLEEILPWNDPCPTTKMIDFFEKNLNLLKSYLCDPSSEPVVPGRLELEHQQLKSKYNKLSSEKDILSWQARELVKEVRQLQEKVWNLEFQTGEGPV